MSAGLRGVLAGALIAIASPVAAELVDAEERDPERALPQTIRRAAPPAPEHRIDFGARITDPRSGMRNELPPGRRLDSIRPGEGRTPARADSTAVIDGRDTEAMIRLALDYYRGINGPRNLAEAYRLFDTAGERGDVRGRMAAGFLLGEGLGTKRDSTRAREILDGLRRQGHGRAGYLRAIVEENHSSAKDKSDRVLALLQEAAGLGDAFAQNQLGIEYERAGQSGTARLWYAEAAKGGSKAAADNLQRMDAKSAKRRVKRPVAVLETEAERGDPVAAYELAQRYHRGEGVPSNYAEALVWYRLSANGEYGPAKQMLALIYSEPAMQNGIDAAWMRRLAQVSLATDGSSPRLESLAEGLPVRESDPLAGLESVSRQRLGRTRDGMPFTHR